MIIDQLFENHKKKTLNEVDPRNYDSDEDYYNDLHGNKEENDDFDVPDEDDYDPPNDDESHYEKYVRVNNLEEVDADPIATATQNTLDKLGARVGADPGSNIDQVTTAYEQKILDRMGKRFGLPPGSTAEQVQAAQQAYLDKNDPAAAAQYKQNMANIDAGGAHADNRPVQLAPTAAPVAEAKRNKQRKLNEAMLMEDPVYRKFKRVGRYIAERKMSEKEILQVFADAEAGMTDKATGANRTFLGRGKDTTMDFAGGVKDAMSSVLNSIQNSVPVAAVDVAYDQATDALANVAGGQKGAVMSAIKKYRNLVKQYPKTAGFAKAALVAIAGLATGGAGLPVIAGLTYALDSAIKGDKLSSVLGKGAGAAALAAAGQAVSGAMNPGQPDIGNVSGGQDIGGYNPDNVPGDFMNTPEPGWQSNADVSGMYAQEPGWGALQADGGTGGTYTVMQGDQGGFIAQANGVPFKDLQALNPDITNWNKLPVGTELNLPPSGDNVGSVWQGTDMSAPGVAPANTGMNPTDMNNFRADNLARMQDQADAAYYAGKPDDYGWVNNKFNATNLTPDFDPKNVPAGMTMKQGVSPVRESIWTKVAESTKLKTLSVNQLIDNKTTVLSWALNESVGRQSKSVNLTTIGTYTVFENIDRYRKSIIKELKGVPGSTRPAYYRPDMADAPTTPDKKPGMIGRGLNWLDKTAGKVGGALSNFGHQFTTGVTKEKLKMNWHQAGKPSDSDQLAAWLGKQGVPPEVITGVFSKMGIPYTAPSATDAAAGTDATTGTATPAKTGGGETSLPYYGINPATKKPYTATELQAKPAAGATPVSAIGSPAATPAPAIGSPAATPATATAAPSAEKFPGEDPTGPNYVGRLEVKRRQAARAAATPAAPAKTTNFAQQSGGYSSVNYAPNIKTGASLPKPTAPAAPAGTKVTSGGPTPDEQARLAQRIAQATAKPVAEMLQMVETKEDVQRIKQFVDQTFAKYGAVNESAFVLRNQIIEHVTQVGAQRRREYSQRVAH